jgi:hypothetical protein
LRDEASRSGHGVRLAYPMISGVFTLRRTLRAVFSPLVDPTAVDVEWMTIEPTG